MSEDREKVYCNECKFYRNLSGLEICKAPQNLGTFRSRGEYNKSPRLANCDNDCEWYEKKEG